MPDGRRLLQRSALQMQCSPVYVAAWNGFCAAIRVLHELGADLNLCDKVPLGPPQAARVQCFPRAQNGLSPVYAAARGGHSDAIELLHGLGADISKPSAVSCASGRGG